MRRVLSATIALLALAGVQTLHAATPLRENGTAIAWLDGAKAPQWAMDAVARVFPRSVSRIRRGDATLGIAPLGGPDERPALVIFWTKQGKCGARGCPVEVIGHRHDRYGFLGAALAKDRQSISLGALGASGWRDLHIGGRRLTWTGTQYAAVDGQAAEAAERHRARLFTLTKRGDTRRLRRLLRRGVDPDLRNEYHLTPLMVTAASGRKQVASILITAGAQVDARGVGDVTPLHAAAVNGRLQTAALLIEHGADTAAKNVFGETPLHWAVMKDPRLIPLLVANGAEIDAADRNGYTALHVAAKKGSRKSAIALLAEGANRRLRDKKGEMPAELAAREGHWNLVPVLRDGVYAAGPAGVALNARPLLTGRERRRMGRHLTKAWRRNRVWSYRKYLGRARAGAEAAFAKALLRSAELVRSKDLRGSRGYFGRLVRIDRENDRLIVAFDMPVKLRWKPLTKVAVVSISRLAYFPKPLVEGARVELYGGIGRTSGKDGWVAVYVRAVD